MTTGSETVPASKRYLDAFILGAIGALGIAVVASVGKLLWYAKERLAWNELVSVAVYSAIAVLFFLILMAIRHIRRGMVQLTGQAVALVEKAKRLEKERDERLPQIKPPRCLEDKKSSLLRVAAQLEGDSGLAKGCEWAREQPTLIALRVWGKRLTRTIGLDQEYRVNELRARHVDAEEWLGEVIKLCNRVLLSADLSEVMRVTVIPSVQQVASALESLKLTSATCRGNDGDAHRECERLGDQKLVAYGAE
jgi:hypothetical protein